jgi:hypothetical protein
VTPAAFFKLSHFQSLLLFALIISIAFGTLGRRKIADRVKYASWCFFWFVILAVAIGWAIYPFSR